MKRKPEALLDISTLLYAQEIEGSNSELIIEELVAGRFLACTCQWVLDEMMRFNQRHYSRLTTVETRFFSQYLPRDSMGEICPPASFTSR